METLRTFIALDMPAEIKTALGSYTQPLKSMRGRVTWVKPENMHLTLKFLGDTPAGRIDEIAAALQEVALTSAPFSATLAGSGVFPNLNYPRVLWVGLEEKTGVLSGLVKAIDERMQTLGFQREKRPFTAHLTIGRAKDTKIQEIVQALRDKPFPAMAAQFHEIIFMKSALLPGGSVYTPIRKFVLGKNS
jgi:2'-5' RNA ligase